MQCTTIRDIKEIVMRREIERGLKDELSKFKDKFELSFKNEQKALQAQIENQKIVV